jgi:hypothetical protein
LEGLEGRRCSARALFRPPNGRFGSRLGPSFGWCSGKRCRALARSMLLHVSSEECEPRRHCEAQRIRRKKEMAQCGGTLGSESLMIPWEHRMSHFSASH